MTQVFQQLDYAEFGRRMMEQIFTPQMLRRTLAEVVPREQQITVEGPTTVQIAARVTVGEVRPLAPASGTHDLRFEAPLSIEMDLAFSLLLAQEQYAASASAPLLLTIRAREPLTIFVEVAPLAAGQIDVRSEGQGNWLDLLKRVGLLDNAIQMQVAGVINAQLAASQPQRSVDVRPLLARMLPPVIAEVAEEVRVAQASAVGG